MTNRLNGPDTSFSINLSGELNIDNAKDLYEQFCSAIENHDHIDLDISGIKKIDLSVLQLLFSFKKEAYLKNTTIRITGPVEDNIKTVLKISGLLHSDVDNDNRFIKMFAAPEEH